MVERLSDADFDLVAEGVVAFADFLFSDGDDLTQHYLERMGQDAKHEYLKGCEDVMTVYRSFRNA